MIVLPAFKTELILIYLKDIFVMKYFILKIEL